MHPPGGSVETRAAGTSCSVSDNCGSHPARGVDTCHAPPRRGSDNLQAAVGTTGSCRTCSSAPPGGCIDRRAASADSGWDSASSATSANCIGALSAPTAKVTERAPHSPSRSPRDRHSHAGGGATCRPQVRRLGSLTDAANSPKAAQPTIANVRILLVEDDPDARDLIARVLRAGGAEVTPASSAAEANAELPAARPDVLVSDIGMPEEDGYSAARRLRAIDAENGAGAAHARLPAVALPRSPGPKPPPRNPPPASRFHLANPSSPPNWSRPIASLAGSPRVTDGAPLSAPSVRGVRVAGLYAQPRGKTYVTSSPRSMMPVLSYNQPHANEPPSSAGFGVDVNAKDRRGTLLAFGSSSSSSANRRLPRRCRGGARPRQRPALVGASRRASTRSPPAAA